MAKTRIARMNGKLYDTGTANTSFITVAKQLKSLGVKNFYFMLEINDISLIGIDPFAVDKDGNPTLTQDQVQRIIIECTINPWYYLREICRIPEQGGTSVRYKANRGNIAQAWCMLHGLDSWLCLPRQQGKTESAIACQCWMYLFGTTNSQFIFINKDGENSKGNLKRLTTQIHMLPAYLRAESVINEDGSRTKSRENATLCYNPITNNQITVKPKATSVDTAMSIARGLTAPIIHYDEPEFTNHIRIIIDNSVSTYETAARIAKSNGGCYCRIFTCTPGDLDSQPGMEAQLILDRTIKWKEALYDMTEDQIQTYLYSHGEDCNRILYIEYQYYQIGLTEEWFRNIASLYTDKITLRREILIQRLRGSSLSPYDQEDLEYIVSTERKPIETLTLLQYYDFDVYTKLNRNTPYLVGVDCSTGGNQDNNAITIIDPWSLEPVAEFECSYIGETQYENLLIELCKHLPKCVLIIERNSVGDGIIDHLMHSSVSTRLYYDKSLDLVQDKMNSMDTVESMLKKQASRKAYVGVFTGTRSRDSMFAILARHVAEYKDKFVSHNVIRDLTRLVRTSSGKIEAGPGFHDDSIMSYLIALYVYYHGNNLSVFGINKGARDEDLNNSGIKALEEIDRRYVSSDLINSVAEREQKEKKTNKELNWEATLRDSIIKAQRRTFDLRKNNLIQDTIFDNSGEAVFDNFDNGEEIPLSFFNEINGIK